MLSLPNSSGNEEDRSSDGEGEASSQASRENGLGEKSGIYRSYVTRGITPAEAIGTRDRWRGRVVRFKRPAIDRDLASLSRSSN